MLVLIGIKKYILFTKSKWTIKDVEEALKKIEMPKTYHLRYPIGRYIHRNTVPVSINRRIGKAFNMGSDEIAIKAETLMNRDREAH